MFLGPVVAGAQGGDEIAEIVFDAVAGGGDVRGADGFLAAEADKIIFVVVGEAEDFVGDDVANIDDEIPGLVNEGRVQMHGDFPVGTSAGGFGNAVGGDDAHGGDPVAPIVGVDAFFGNRTEHPAIFFRGVGNVLPEGGNDMGIATSGQGVKNPFGDLAGSAVGAGEIGRKKKDAFERRTESGARLIEDTDGEFLDGCFVDGGLFERIPGHGSECVSGEKTFNLFSEAGSGSDAQRQGM